MRRSVLCQRLRGTVLSFVLLTASFASIPFTTIAQTESPSEKTNETKESAEKEIVLTIEGIMNGGTFIFKENRIKAYSVHDGTQLKVNGIPWNDFENEFFELDYTPDFAKAVILEKECEPNVNIYMISRRNDYFILNSVSKASRLRSESKSPRKTRSLATLTPFLPPGQKRKEANLKKLWFLRLPAIPRKRSRRIPNRHSPSGSGADNGTKRIENNSDQWPAVRDFVQWSAVRSVWKCPLQRDDHTQKRNSRTGAGAEK